jgi:hypothetical protein
MIPYCFGSWSACDPINADKCARAYICYKCEEEQVDYFIHGPGDDDAVDQSDE